MISWNQKELVRWIGTDGRPLRKSSREGYKVAFRKYSKFTAKSAKKLIDEAEYEYTEASKRERGIVKNRLLNFREWMIQQGSSSSTAHTNLQCIRSFYTANNFPVKFGRRELPKVFAKTQRKMLTIEEVKKLIHSATNHRDRTMILCLYQSGLDLDTLLNLTYADYRRARNFNGRKMLTVVRRKVGGLHRTFLGRDAVNAVETLILGKKLALDDYLFSETRNLKGRKRGVFSMFRRLAVKSGVLTQEELDHSPINSCGSHALRASFSKIGTAVGINKNVLDYWMGHITPYSGAYTDLPDSELYRIYLKLEPHISTSQAIVSAMDKLREQGRLWGIDLDEAIERRAKAMAESGMGSGGGEFPDHENEEFAREVLKEEIQKLMGKPQPSPEGRPQQKVVLENDLEEYLAQGWRYVSSLNNGSHKCIVQKA